MPLVDLDRQAPAAEAEPEREAGEVLRQPGGEAQLAVVITHSTQAGDGGGPDSASEAMWSLAEIVLSEFQMAHLCGHDRVGARRSEESRTVRRL